MGIFSFRFSPRSSSDRKENSSPPHTAIASIETVCSKAPLQFDWRVSEGYQRLLLNFTFPNSIDGIPKGIDWDEALHEPLASAIDRLKTEGVLIPVTEPISRILHRRGANDLKELCKQHGLKAIGNKEQLAERLTEIDPSGLALGFAGELFRCSLEAEQIANASKEEWKRSRLNDPDLGNMFTLKEFEEEKDAVTKRFLSKGYQKPSDNDVKWALLNKRLAQSAREGNVGFARNVYLVMANVLKRRDKLKDALRLYLIVCAYDLNGANNRGRLPTETRGEFPLFDAAHAALAPVVVKHVIAIADLEKLSTTDLMRMYVDSTSRSNFPLNTEKTWLVLSQVLEGKIDLDDQPKGFEKIRSLLD